MISTEFLAVLACPRCPERPPLELKDDRLVCTQCQWSYPIVEGIPHLLPESAEPPNQPQE